MFYIPRKESLKKSFLDKQATFFFANPGMGKTEFIKKELYDENMIYIDLSNIYNLKDFAYSLIKETSIFFNKRIVTPNKDIDEVTLFKSALLYPIYESEDKRYDNLVLCFDNINYILDFHLKNKDEIYNLFADILQKSSVKMIFSINKLPGKDIFLNPKSSLFGLVEEIQFLELEDSKIIQVVNGYLENFNMSLDMKHFEQIIEDLGFNKRYLQYFVKELITCNKVDDITVTECIKRVYQHLEYELKYELTSLIGKKNLSDILYYVANKFNSYSVALDINGMMKSNVKITLNLLEASGLIVKDRHKKLICRDIVLERYILKNFNKRKV